MNITEQFQTAAEVAAEAATAWRSRVGSEPGDYPAADPSTRHVLIVEPDGWAYIAPHLPGNHDLAECERVALASRAFLGKPNWAGARGAGVGPGPGRYWCSASEDGVFEIGSRLPDFVPSGDLLEGVLP